MPYFYLDLETTGLDPTKDKIITIQFAELDSFTGEQMGELEILKEWESDEKAILSRFVEDSGISDPNPFSFIPVGFNLQFDHRFLSQRCVSNGMESVDIASKPSIDLKPLAVMMNKGQFKGSGLDKITEKPHNGQQIPTWYGKKRYSEIENYVKIESIEFINFYAWLLDRLPALLVRFKIEKSHMR